MSGHLKLLQNLRRHVQAVAYGSPIYNKMVLEQGAPPTRLHLALPDPWPGDAKAGQALIAAQPGLFEAENRKRGERDKPFMAHAWLRDLRAVGTDAARRKALKLLEDWLESEDVWREDSWSPEVLGERLANWIGFHDFYVANAAEDFSARIIASMMRQLRHLLRVMPAPLVGVDNLLAVKGLIFAGLALQDDGARALGLGLELLQRQLAAEILPDGGHIARAPYQHLQILRGLIDVRAALRVTHMLVPSSLTSSIERMVPALKLYRHGDGGLALFHGGHEGGSLEMEAALTLAETRGRVLRRLPQTGYERVTAGRSLLLMDVGAPPPHHHDANAHAGLLSFEFSVGRERLIVNCGAGRDENPEWRRAMAATAAHTCLTLEDTNACEILPDGGIGHRPKQVEAQRYEQNGVPYIEAMHDGYISAFRVTHHRTLGLANEGEELRGREVISGPAGRNFALRWHLHPTVQAALLQGGQAALLRTPSGGGWRLRIVGPREGDDIVGIGGGYSLGLEASVYCGALLPRRTLQLKVCGRTEIEQTVIEWVLTRERKG